MADITVTQNVLVPMVREVHISRFFPTGNKNDFSAFIFNIGSAACNTRVKQDTTKHQQDQFFLHRIHFPLTWMELEQSHARAYIRYSIGNDPCFENIAV